MISLLVVAVLATAAGFGLGRVKNKAKLAVAQAELDKLKAIAESAVAKVITTSKSL